MLSNRSWQEQLKWGSVSHQFIIRYVRSIHKKVFLKYTQEDLSSQELSSQPSSITRMTCYTAYPSKDFKFYWRRTIGSFLKCWNIKTQRNKAILDSSSNYKFFSTPSIISHLMEHNHINYLYLPPLSWNFLIWKWCWNVISLFPR